jgi:hypothetical protein
MHKLYSWPWVEAQAVETAAIWRDCAGKPIPSGPDYSLKEQKKREHAYDQALHEVEREAKRTRNVGPPSLNVGAPSLPRFLRQGWEPRMPNAALSNSPPHSREAHLATQARVTQSFAHFSAQALDLSPEAIDLLTQDFLPAGTQLARWARRFDPTLSMSDIVQAARNAWTACGLQPLFGERLRLTPSILGYSLLYPYSDNYLDRDGLSTQDKLRFSHRFRQRLHGEDLPIEDARELALAAMIHLIEGQYPRAEFPQIFDCLLAIHRAQENSLRQLTRGPQSSEQEILDISCSKGGTSVLADAILARGWLTEAEIRFAFEWGVLLQLGDDLQDLAEDLRRGSMTLFTRAASRGIPLDNLTSQLLNFSERVANRMDSLDHGSPMFRSLLRMAWRSLIVGAVAYSHEYFSPAFLAEAERSSPFRFAFLRRRRNRLTSRRGLFANLFQAFLEAPEDTGSALPSPESLYHSSREVFALTAHSS